MHAGEWTTAAAVVGIVLSSSGGAPAPDAKAPGGEMTPAAGRIRIFDGQPRVVVVHGYSTSFHWPKVLQRKCDRYFDGRRIITVRSATKGGTPIAKWMDVAAGRPTAAWEIVRKALKPPDANTPVIVLAQQSLQWVYGDRQAGIRGKDDDERIKQGADALEKYARLLHADGADLVFIAMHIYKQPMEPAIGNERLALAEVMKRGLAFLRGGPDVWEPTSKLWPKAFAGDKVHPNSIGDEVMAHHWFAWLLGHDGLQVPDWSAREMNEAVAKGPQAGPGRGGRPRP